MSLQHDSEDENMWDFLACSHFKKEQGDEKGKRRKKNQAFLSPNSPTPRATGSSAIAFFLTLLLFCFPFYLLARTTRKRYPWRGNQ